MSSLTYDELLTVARRLSLADRLRLASTLVHEAAGEVAPPSGHQPMTPAEALSALDAVRAHFASQGPVNPTIADDLSDSRR
ncbi:MAG: hypothetical protein HC822_13735 [Oscillochloris sp.]|nr:hypothetical protein [Oscillochloris sp.]